MNKKFLFGMFAVFIMMALPLASADKEVWKYSSFPSGWTFGPKAQVFGIGGFRDMGSSSAPDGVVKKGMDEFYGRDSVDNPYPGEISTIGRNFIAMCVDLPAMGPFRPEAFKGIILSEVVMDENINCLSESCNPESCNLNDESDKCNSELLRTIVPIARFEYDGCDSENVPRRPDILLPQHSFHLDKSGIYLGYYDGLTSMSPPYGMQGGVHKFGFDGEYKGKVGQAPDAPLCCSENPSDCKVPCTSFAYDKNNERWWTGETGDRRLFYWKGGSTDWTYSTVYGPRYAFGWVSHVGIVVIGDKLIAMDNKGGVLNVWKSDGDGLPVEPYEKYQLYDPPFGNPPSSSGGYRLDSIGTGPFRHLWGVAGGYDSGTFFFEFGGGDLDFGKCGDGVVQEEWEQCDSDNSECAADEICMMSGIESCICVMNPCGNGHLDPGEECDDGNNIDGDDCSATCLSEVCGNNRVDFGEECDGTDDSSCPGQCSGCVCPAANPCGNGHLDPGEECDDGNNIDGDDCSATCLSEVCNNNRVDFGEECDGTDDSSCPGQCSGCVCPAGYDGQFVKDETVMSQSMSHTFEVVFEDLSNPVFDPVVWKFKKEEVGLDCTENTKDSVDNLLNPTTRDIANGQKESIGFITLETNSEGSCYVSLGAYAPDGALADKITYLLEDLPLCPECVVLELPAIIHPLNIYSSSPTKANEMYAKADSAVSRLGELCEDYGPNCGGRIDAKSKLEYAQMNLEASKKYNTQCQNTGDPTGCKLTQYYAARSSELIIEGMELVGD